MLRHLLVCLKPTPGNQACQAAAVDLGVQTGAVLSGVFVRAPAPAPLVEADERVLEHRAAQDRLQESVFTSFQHLAQEAGVRAGTILRSGNVHDELVASAQATDMVMIGRDWRRPETLLESVAGELVRAVGRPVMVVSEWRAPLDTIAVAYDGSMSADRALASAADLATRWSGKRPELVLVAVLDHEDDSLRFLEPARRYLNAYDLTYRVSTAPGDPGTLITALGIASQAGLLCMGAYGHSLLREALLGSTTHRVLASWSRALLLTC